MRKTTIAGVVLAVVLCSGLASQNFSVEAKPEQKAPAKVTTEAQAANIARLHYINGGRGIAYKGKPETIPNWKNPTIYRIRSKQKNLLWNVNFVTPNVKISGSDFPITAFTITVAENGKVVQVANEGWFN